MHRFLLYQPNHGLGVEAHLLETMLLLGEITGRTVVLPRMPVLETARYEHGLEEYLIIKKTWPWCSDTDFRSTGRPVDLLLHIIPAWSKSFRSSKVIEIHPSWYTNILQPEYFQKVSIEVKSTQRVELDLPLSAPAVLKLIPKDIGVVALSYINGIVERCLCPRPAAGNHFRFHRSAPSGVALGFREDARAFTRNAIYDCIHFRSNQTLRMMASEVWEQSLPVYGDLARVLRRSAGVKTFLCTDFEQWEQLSLDPGTVSTRQSGLSGNAAAAFDLAVACAARNFVGVDASTFSHLIVHLREVCQAHGQCDLLCAMTVE